MKSNTQLAFNFPVVIELSGGYSTVVSIQDSDLLQYKWHTQKGTNAVYVSNNQEGRLHRVIVARVLGRELARAEQVDHIDGNSLNNTRENLRLATAAQNSWNSKKRKNNLSGFKGVSAYPHGKKRWKASIYIHNKRIDLGLFDTPQEAHAAYCEAAVKHYGEFARFE